MVRGLRRSYSCVVCFLCMPSAMMVTGVSVHTSVAQLASTSSSVSSSPTNSLRDYELDKRVQQDHQEQTLPLRQAQVLELGGCALLQLWRRGIANSQDHVWKSEPFCWVSEKPHQQEIYSGRLHCRKDGQRNSRLPQFSLVAVRELGKSRPSKMA